MRNALRSRDWFSRLGWVAMGVVIAWFAAGRSEPKVIAVPVGQQSPDGAALVTGPVSFQYNDRTKVQINQDALYFLDYRAGKLYATIPEQRSTVNKTSLISAFVERDLVADFKIDANATASPQFLMSTGGLGAMGDNLAPLYIFETTTRQVAVYKLSQQTVGTISRPRFDLTELKSIQALARPNNATPLIPSVPDLPTLP